jgi:hypothetical protein
MLSGDSTTADVLSEDRPAEGAWDLVDAAELPADYHEAVLAQWGSGS